MLTGAVAGADAKSSGYLRAYLQQTGLVKSVSEWGTDPARYPGPGESVPDVVLLDLVREIEAAFAFAAHLRRIRPSVCVIACSAVAQPDPDLLIRAMRSGVQDFLSHPLDPAALREILTRVDSEHQTAEPEAAEKLIVVLGSKGGVGATTVAVNLGVQLAQLTQKRAAVLDFARPLGHVSLLLDLQPRFSVRDAVENLERLDVHFLGGLLTHHKSNLDVLAGTSYPDEWQHIPIPALVRVVNVAQSGWEYVIVDLGSVYSSEWSSLLHLARAIILVAEADVPALWTLERHVSTISSFGLDPDKFRIVINRWHREDEETLKAFEKKINRTIFARLPNDFRQVSEAINLGAPLSRNNNDGLVSKFRTLATQLSGIAPKPKDAKKGTIFSLFTAPAPRTR